MQLGHISCRWLNESSPCDCSDSVAVAMDASIGTGGGSALQGDDGGSAVLIFVYELFIHREGPL